MKTMKITKELIKKILVELPKTMRALANTIAITCDHTIRGNKTSTLALQSAIMNKVTELLGNMEGYEIVHINGELFRKLICLNALTELFTETRHLDFLTREDLKYLFRTFLSKDWDKLLATFAVNNITNEITETIEKLAQVNPEK